MLQLLIWEISVSLIKLENEKYNLLYFSFHSWHWNWFANVEQNFIPADFTLFCIFDGSTLTIRLMRLSHMSLLVTVRRAFIFDWRLNCFPLQETPHMEKNSAFNIYFRAVTWNYLQESHHMYILVSYVFKAIKCMQTRRKDTVHHSRFGKVHICVETFLSMSLQHNSQAQTFSAPSSKRL